MKNKGTKDKRKLLNRACQSTTIEGIHNYISNLLFYDTNSATEVH